MISYPFDAIFWARSLLLNFFLPLVDVGIMNLQLGSLPELQRLYDELVEKVDACRLDLYATSKSTVR